MPNFRRTENLDLNPFKKVNRLDAINKDRERVEEPKQQELKKKQEEEEKNKEPQTKHNNDDKGKRINTFA